MECYYVTDVLTRPCKEKTVEREAKKKLLDPGKCYGDVTVQHLYDIECTKHFAYVDDLAIIAQEQFQDSLTILSKPIIKLDEYYTNNSFRGQIHIQYLLFGKQMLQMYTVQVVKE